MRDFPVGGLPSFPTTARLASATPQMGVLDNRRSFWIQREHLLQAIKDVGVDLVMEEYDNLEPSIAESLLVGSYAANLRGTFIGIKTR